MTESVVRFGPHRISINTNTGLRDSYGVRLNVQESQFYSVSSPFFKILMSMTTIDRKAHAFQRTIDAGTLSHTCIQEMEQAIFENIRLFCYKIFGNQFSERMAQSHRFDRIDRIPNDRHHGRHYRSSKLGNGGKKLEQRHSLGYLPKE